MAGKIVSDQDAPAQNTRFKVRSSDVYSPAKQPARKLTRKFTGDLRARDRSQPTAQPGRRNSWSLPDDSPPKQPRGRPKKKITLNKTSKDTHASPLKKYGHDIPLNQNSSVNLDESPAKNTRSKQSNLSQKLPSQATFPPSSSAQEDIQEPKKRQSRHTRSPNSQKTLQDSRKRAREDDPTESPTCESVKRVRKDSGEEEQQAEQAQGSSKNTGSEIDSSGAQSQRYEPTSADTPQEQSKSKVKGQKGNQEQRVDLNQTSTQAQAVRSALNSDKTDGMLEKKMITFIKGIEAVAGVNDCTDYWMQAGGAAGMILAMASTASAVTDQAKSVKSCVDKLKDAYKKLQKDTTTQEHDVSRLIKDLVNSKDKLRSQSQSNRQTKSDLVQDIYQHIIPGMVFLLKSFLLARYKERAFTVPETRELLQLVSLTIKMCRLALDWHPRPSTLTYGVLRLMRNNIGPNLKLISNAYKPAVDRHDRVHGEREAISDLAERSAAAHRELKQRLEDERQERRLACRSNSSSRYREGCNTGISHSSSSHNPPGQEVYDIDEIQVDSRTLPSRELGTAQVTGKQMSARSYKQRPQLVREPTVELAPPPAASLNGQEKIALLNGLQKYTGHDRYSDILNDAELGDILGKYDLDVLMDATISFSRMMLSKMGADAYRADKSLEWLRSADPEVGEDVSVVV